jgi:hypothetical protein
VVSGLWSAIGEAENSVCPIFPYSPFTISPFSIRNSQFPTVPSCPKGVPRCFGTANPLIRSGLAEHKTRFWHVLKKHLSHTCGTSSFFALRGRSWRDQCPKSHVVKDQTPDRRHCRTAGYQPAMSAKREHLSCGSPHEVRAKHSSRDYAARSAGSVPVGHLPTGSASVTRGYIYSAAPQLRISCVFRVI